jgi:hypothetical protein
MSFDDIIKIILPELEDGKYSPYVNGGGSVLGKTDYRRSDYDDKRTQK